MELIFLGTSAAIPTVRRNVTSVCVQTERESLLVDVGEGTQMQILRGGIRRGRIQRILITHLHGDHFFGLIGLLTSYQLGKREEPLELIGPPGLAAYIRFMKDLCRTDFGYELTITELPDVREPRTVLETRCYTVVAAPLKHRLYTLGYRIQERERPGVFDAERADRLGVPFGPERKELIQGRPLRLADGTVVDPAEVVGAPRPGRSIAICTDTAPCPMAVRLAESADVLVHEATFEPADRRHARRTLHSTSLDAARAAREAGARHLFLSHISSRYLADTAPLLEGLEAVHDSVRLARDFMQVRLALHGGGIEIFDCRDRPASEAAEAADQS